MLKETAQVERHGAMVSAPDLRLYMQDCRLTPSPTSCFNNLSRQRSINGCQLNEQSAVTQNSYENVHQLNQKKHQICDRYDWNYHNCSFHALWIGFSDSFNPALIFRAKSLGEAHHFSLSASMWFSLSVRVQLAHRICPEYTAAPVWVESGRRCVASAIVHRLRRNSNTSHSNSLPLQPSHC